MKRLSMLLAAGFVALVAACSSFPTQSPAQIAANICPGVQSEINVLQQSGVFTGGAQATLTNQVQPDIDAVCKAGANVTAAGISNLVSATFPLVLTVIGNSSLTDTQKLQASVAVGVVVTGINTALSLQTAPATTLPASSPVAASAALVA